MVVTVSDAVFVLLGYTPRNKKHGMLHRLTMPLCNVARPSGLRR